MLELWWIYKNIYYNWSIELFNRLAYAYRRCFVLLIIPHVNGTKPTWIWPGHFNDQISILASKGLRHKDVRENMIIGMCRLTLPSYECSKRYALIYIIYTDHTKTVLHFFGKNNSFDIPLKYNINHTQRVFMWKSWFSLRCLLPWQLFMMWYTFINIQNKHSRW